MQAGRKGISNALFLNIGDEDISADYALNGLYI